jgi:hypothetical protein
MFFEAREPRVVLRRTQDSAADESLMTYDILTLSSICLFLASTPHTAQRSKDPTDRLGVFQFTALLSNHKYETGRKKHAMTFVNTVDVVHVQAPASELWKCVNKAYGQNQNYGDFIDSTTMDDAKLAVPHASSA